MKRVLMMLCAGAMISMLAGCGDDESTRMAAQSDGDYIADDEASYTDEEYTDEEYIDEEYSDEEYSESSDSDLAAEIDKFTDIYVGDYGNGNEIIMGFNYDDTVQKAVIMIYNVDKKEVSYINDGNVTGNPGELQTVTGTSDYPYTFTISEVSEDGKTMVLAFENDGECTVNACDAYYFKEVCTYLGMM